ncbi:MAG: acyltransferase family protein [Acutalibacteraceae bacterium]
MKKERIAWIDQLKGFAFFTVILGHALTNATVKSWIYSFHMPLFLLITGFTLNIEKLYASDFLSVLKKNTKRMILPYVWCQLLCIIPFVINVHLASKRIQIKDLLLGILCSNSRIYPMPSLPGYYIIILFFSQLLLWAVIKITKKNQTMTAVILCVLAAFGAASGYGAVIWHLNVVPTAAFIIFIGKILMEQYIKNKDIIDNLSKVKYGLSCVVLLALGAAFCSFNGRVSLHYNSYGNQYIYFLVSMLATSIAFCLIFIRLRPIKILDYVGKNTLFYMMMHLPVLLLLKRLEGSFSEHFYMDYINSVIIFLILIPLTKLAEKYAPFLLGREYTNFGLSSQIGAFTTLALAASVSFYELATKLVALTSPLHYLLFVLVFLAICTVIYFISIRLFPVVFLCKKETVHAAFSKEKRRLSHRNIPQDP